MVQYSTLCATSRITARSATVSRIVCRDASQFKLVNAVINTADEQGTDERAKPVLAKPGKSASGTPPYAVFEKEPALEETASSKDTETPSEKQRTNPTRN